MTSPNDLASAVTDVLPPDSEMRIGVANSGSSFTVDVEGQAVPAGRLASYGPVAGEPVALFRQDATWLALGSTVGPAATGRGIISVQTTIASNNLNLLSGAATIPGTTITFTTSTPNALLVAWWDVDLEAIGATATLGVVRLNVDGANVTNPAATFNQAAAGTGARATCGASSINTLATPGTHTVLLSGLRIGGADNQIRANSNQTSLTIMVVG